MSNETRGQLIGPWWVDKIVLNEISVDTVVTDAKEINPSIDFKKLITKIRMSMLSLKGSYMNEDGTCVDYKGMVGSKEYQDYVQLTSNLKHINLIDMDNEQRKGFLINTYNCLCIHALAAGLLGKSILGQSIARLRLYASASYRIGNYNYSLNDIENGLLRNNSPGAAPWSKIPFNSNDPRLKYVIVPIDPRIHFTLNCGASSCPPRAVYDIDIDIDKHKKLEKQLNLATRGFIETPSNICINTNCNEVKLSMIFKWYENDFINIYDNNNDDNKVKNKLLQWIGQHSGDDIATQIASLKHPVSIKYFDYDWGLND